MGEALISRRGGTDKSKGLTAVESDILTGKTAEVNGEVLTGTNVGSLIGSITIVDNYFIVNVAGYFMAYTDDNKVIIVFKSKGTDYENHGFVLASAPSFVTLTQSGSNTFSSQYPDHFYCCILNNVYQKIDVSCAYYDKDSEDDTVIWGVTVTYA